MFNSNITENVKNRLVRRNARPIETVSADPTGRRTLACVAYNKIRAVMNPLSYVILDRVVCILWSLIFASLGELDSHSLMLFGTE